MKAQGHTLLEALLVLALLSILGAAGGVALATQGPGLTFLPAELRAAVDQAFLLARARGGDVRLALGGPGGDVAPVVLPRGLRWGLPGAGVPVPPGLRQPRRAHLTGAAHPVVTVTPRGTATGTAWYLTDGRDAVYVGLTGRGEVHVRRWRASRWAWADT
ncbi:prepilin-type N-terminal cleavage/methylation domain-containing protein [Mesoterricola silvestris]|uniref:Uncharacterized protein n=1 Tax=Mesoterricola silvestris TaxID=2927979 RepID=A0AA48GJ87_9BACT|nr:prepilin-type N-terminal cleavage/methylation domain-containing protein [Mesoterricola silvestris]BDU72114.1 hypothetical protein METEAL_12880 [Mesoterricola silvestris]